MTPEQKAIELLEKLIPHVYNEYDGSDGGKVYNAKRHTIQTALILVDEVQNTLTNKRDEFVITPNLAGGYKDMNEYWQEVKNELEKL